MRVGFVTQLLWPRYGAFWRSLVRNAGAEAVFPTPEGVRAALGNERVRGVPTASFRLAVAQAASLAGEVDVLVVPSLNPDDGATKGGAQDPWIADFPGALRATLAGLPHVRSVPTEFGESIEGQAVEFLHSLLAEGRTVRRAWERSRPYAKPTRLPAVAMQLLPGETRTVAVLGQPWLVNDALVGATRQADEHVVAIHQLDPLVTREEGLRAQPELLGTDAEVLGAARLLGRRASIGRLRLVVDPGSGSDAWLARRLREAAHKPVEVVDLREALSERDSVDTLSNWQLD